MAPSTAGESLDEGDRGDSESSAARAATLPKSPMLLVLLPLP